MNNENIIVRVQEEPIDVGQLIKEMKTASAGALSIFLGIFNLNQEQREIILKGRKSQSFYTKRIPQWRLKN
jgi:molybdopterin synthase catalytic subunit